METEYNEERTPIVLGRLEIDPPQASQAGFSIMVDLAGLLDVETNGEAAKRLEDALRVRKPQKPKGSLQVDSESDYVFIDASNTATLVHVLHALLDVGGEKLGYRNVDIDDRRAQFDELERTRPKPQKWATGDVFTFKLEDGTWGYGQVIGVAVKAPTCALLDEHSSAPAFDAEAISTARVLSILHCDGSELASGRWRVIGHLHPVADPWSGPCGHPLEVGGRSWGVIEPLANAYYGLSPWNEFADANAFDKILLAGVRRPPNAKIATKTELEERERTVRSRAAKAQ